MAEFTFPLVQPPPMPQILGIADTSRAIVTRPNNTTAYAVQDVIHGRVFLTSNSDATHKGYLVAAPEWQDAFDDIYSGTLTGGDELIEEWVTPAPGVSQIDGTLQINIIASGSDLVANTRIIARVSRVSAARVVSGSVYSGEATIDGNTTEYTLSVDLSAFTMDVDDRLLIRIYARSNAPTIESPTVILGIGGGSTGASITWPGVIVFENCSPVREGSGVVQIVHCSQNPTPETLPVLELWLFDAPPSLHLDNATLYLTQADLQKLIAVIPLNDQQYGSYYDTTHVSPEINRPFSTKNQTKNLYGLLVVREAYTPAANEQFLLSLGLVADRV